MKTSRLAAFVVALLLAAPALAQETPPAETPPAETPPAVAPAPAAPAAAAAAVGKKYLSPGIIEIGGGISLGYNVESGDGGYSQKTFNFGLTPYVLYFIMKNLAVGGRFTVDYRKIWTSATGQPETSGDQTGIIIQPAAEYHFDLGSRLFPYAGLALGYGYAGFGDTKDNQMVFNVGGGVKMNFGSGGLVGIGLEIPIIYHSYTVNNVPGTGHTTTAGFNIFTRYAVYF